MNADISFENSVIEQVKTEDEQGFDKTSETLRAGIKAAQAGDRSQARHLLLSVTEADSGNENAWLWLASISEYPEELLIFLRNVLSINPYNERALEWSKATKSLLAKTFVQRGIDAHKQDQADFAKQCFLQAIFNDDKNEMAWLWLASTTEAVEEKMSHLQKVLRINPENVSAQTSLDAARSQKAQNLMQKANAAAISGQHEEAQTILEEVLQNFPDLEDAWVLKSYLTNSFDEKLEYFEKVLDINPANETAQASINSIRQMKAAAAIKEAEEEPNIPEEKVYPRAEADFELSEYDEFRTNGSFAPESVEIEESGEFEFSNEEFHAAAPETAYSEPAFEENGAHWNEEQHLPETPADFQPEENSYQANSYHDEPLDLAPEAPVSGYAGNYQEEIEIFEPLESHNEDFYSQRIDEQKTEEVIEFAEESADLSFEETRTDSAEIIEPFQEIETANSDYSQFAAYEDDHDDHSYNGFAGENAFAPSEIAENGDFFDGSTAPENFEAEHIEQESFETAGGEAEAFSNEEFDAEDFETNSNGNEAVYFSGHEETACPFCRTGNEPQAFVCGGCRAVLTLSDLEMILAHKDADAEMLRRAIEQMEGDELGGEYGAEDLTMLGIGCINLKNLPGGLNYLRKAAKLDPNNVLLNSQVNSLAIRLAEIEKQESVHNSMPQDRTIMVVDDSATVRKLISGKLEKSGHTVICAVDGIDALEKLKEVTPDLVLLDITMPRMDGYQVCKLIRNNPDMKDIPVVMISGKDGFFDKVRGRMAGTTGYITKPFGPETLMKTVEAFVSQAPEFIEETVEV